MILKSVAHYLKEVGKLDKLVSVLGCLQLYPLSGASECVTSVRSSNGQLPSLNIIMYIIRIYIYYIYIYIYNI